MFEKDIERDIQGVIKVDQKENIYQELDEYVVTKELLKHFTDFFSSYSEALFNPTDDIGVWISGFFGSGKSHFLKILSYILDSNLTVKGRKPIDFFDEDKKITDAKVIADMKSATSVDTDVILFNIDSKSAQDEKKDILKVFIRVFNEMRGYCGGLPFLADLEKQLDNKGKFDQFKEEFLEITGDKWEEKRDEFFFIQDEIVEAIVNIDFMSEEAARTWAEKAEENIDITIENFAKEVNEYCKSKGNNHHIIFLVDEVGQYIADNTQLMLNLQTIVEELGIKCHGKAWVVVTSQQNIDDITKDIRGIDFSKIQGRFKTRLSLSSSNVDEVIRRRILAKNETAEKFLESYYPQIEPTLKNIISFDGKVEMKTYENAEDFANIYPFVPYQFQRVQDVLTSIREHSASGKHMADGERSMLALFKESAIAMKNEVDGAIVPFNVFYRAIETFIDHTHKNVIIRAEDNDRLTSFDVEVLKVLFMIKYVKEIKATPNDLTTLMISNINEDRLELKDKIENSLKRLLEQTLIQKNGDVYSFLTNEEQDINREIKNELIEVGEILDETSNRVFAGIYKTNKYKVSNRYNFAFNQSIDNREKGGRKYDIGIRIITPYYETEVNMGSGQTQLDDAGNTVYNVLKGLSDSNNEVIVMLPNDLAVFDEIKETLQISKYLTKKSGDLRAELRARKQEEYNDKTKRIDLFLEEAIKRAVIFVKGDKVDIVEKNASDRLDEAMGKLIDKVYNKLYYMNDFAPDKKDILNTLKDEVQETFEFEDKTCINALNDLDEYVLAQFNVHNTLTLKAIIDRFSKAPYGFTNLDIQWLVTKLLVQRRVSLSINSEEISLKNQDKNKIFDYITKKEYDEKILVSKREKTNVNYIKSVKDILREVFNQNVTIDNDEKLMEVFKKRNDEKLDNINKCLIEFKGFTHYPGRSILEESFELFNEIKGKNSIAEFYKYIYNHEDDILDVSDDLMPVLSFFTGSQKGIFKEAWDVYRSYETNKNLLQNKELEEIAESINSILQMPNPYSKIKDLPSLNKEFDEKLDVILDEKRKIIRNDIKNDCSSVMDSLTDTDLKEQFENRFKSEFSQLMDKLNSEKNISIIKGITDESENLRVDALNDIHKFIELKQESSPEIKPIIKEANVSIKEILTSSKVRIESEDDLNDFFKKVETKVRAELKNNNIVNLKF